MRVSTQVHFRLLPPTFSAVVGMTVANSFHVNWIMGTDRDMKPIEEIYYLNRLVVYHTLHIPFLYFIYI